MPLIVITGLPSSGKSTRAAQLRKLFEDYGKTVHLISEWQCVQLAGYSKNEYFDDPQKEKLIRSNVKSEALRLLNKDDLVIIDGANYIKGYRYEIFCASKSSRTTQCTVYCANTKEQSWAFNELRRDETEKYHEDIFKALCLRYEEPQHNNRWDSPLFTVFPEDELGKDDIFKAIYSTKALIPNLSTQNPPLSSTNFLFEMDKTTQDVINQILSARKIGLTGSVRISGAGNVPAEVPSEMNASQLNRHRRQFLNYMKLHTTASITVDKIPSMFVQFLNANCK
ncbi:protein KTI12 homolog [Armigeres subalbatus]|uniref:protein KTI12 homolog n=1 Tax=Armigeres subalbatus TaxID=124917 RepID=UPI002ED08CAC